MSIAWSTLVSKRRLQMSKIQFVAHPSFKSFPNFHNSSLNCKCSHCCKTVFLAKCTAWEFRHVVYDLSTLTNWLWTEPISDTTAPNSGGQFASYSSPRRKCDTKIDGLPVRHRGKGRPGRRGCGGQRGRQGSEGEDRQRLRTAISAMDDIRTAQDWKRRAQGLHSVEETYE